MRLLLLLALIGSAKAKKVKKPPSPLQAGMECDAIKEIPTVSGAIKLVPAGAHVKVLAVTDETVKIETASGVASVKKKTFLADCPPKNAPPAVVPQD